MEVMQTPRARKKEREMNSKISSKCECWWLQLLHLVRLARSAPRQRVFVNKSLDMCKCHSLQRIVQVLQFVNGHSL
jgi:hypothetical protein